MVFSQNVSPGAPNSLLQVAVKNNQQPVWYFSDKGFLHVFFGEDGKMERTSFLEVLISKYFLLCGTALFSVLVVLIHLAICFFIRKLLENACGEYSSAFVSLFICSLKWLNLIAGLEIFT